MICPLPRCVTHCVAAIGGASNFSVQTPLVGTLPRSLVALESYSGAMSFLSEAQK